MDKKNSKDNRFADVSFGWVSAVGIFFYCGLGYWIDQKFQTGYLWTLIGFCIGLVLLIYEVWKIIQNVNMKDRSKK